jgi:hypothetical protein
VLVATIFLIFVAEDYTGIYSMTAQYYFSNLDSETEGVIVVSEGTNYNTMRSLGPYMYEVEYSYYVQDQSRMYRNNIVKYDIRDKEVDRILENYPLGKKVTVYYDSDSPFWAVLEKGTYLPSTIFIKCIVILLVSPLVGLFILWISKD